MMRGTWRESLTIYKRTAETDTWALVGTVMGELTAMSAAGARRESHLQEPDLTHHGRLQRHDELLPGRRVRRASDGAEYVIRIVRNWDRPPPGHAHVLLAEVEGVVA